MRADEAADADAYEQTHGTGSGVRLSLIVAFPGKAGQRQMLLRVWQG